MNSATIVAICTGSVTAALAIAIPYMQRVVRKRDKRTDQTLIQRDRHQQRVYLQLVKIRSYTRAVLEAVEDTLTQRPGKVIADFPRNSVYTDMAHNLGNEFPGIESSYLTFIQLAAKTIDQQAYKSTKFRGNKDRQTLAAQVSELRNLREELKRELKMAANSIGYDVVGDESAD